MSLPLPWIERWFTCVEQDIFRSETGYFSKPLNKADLMHIITSVLDAPYHELWSSTSSEGVRHFAGRGDDSFYDNWPGFWYTTDKDGWYVRCGTIENILEFRETWQPWPSEKRIYLHSAYRRSYLREMKVYKQQFKRLVKRVQESKRYLDATRGTQELKAMKSIL